MTMFETTSDRQRYWKQFYSQKDPLGSLQAPSQFAAFVAQEIEPGTAVFDVGCGNGRDSLFFAALGLRVLAMDISENAIHAVRRKTSEQGISNLNCVVGDVTGSHLADAINGLGVRTACIYARFFLHAITDDEQTDFFKTLAWKLQPGHMLALEYRTTADQYLEKHAPPHFRRYQSAENVNIALQSHGFEMLYETEGQGYAKYRDEDAIIARSIFRKT